jgi:hypothetical protein
MHESRVAAGSVSYSYLLNMKYIAKSTVMIPAIAATLVMVTAWWLFGAKWSLGVSNEWSVKPNPGAWPLGGWLLPLAVLGLFGGLAGFAAYDRFRRAKTRREQKASTALCLGALSLLALLWPWALLGPGGTFNLIATTWGDISNEYFSTSYRVDDARRFTRDYTTQWQRPKSVVQAHVATHPPGAVLFYYGARRVFERFPPLQNAFAGLTQYLITEPVTVVASQSRDLLRRTSGTAPELPDSAAPAALWCAFLVSLAMAATVPAVYLLAGGDGAAQVGTNDTPGRADSEARGLTAAALFAMAPSVGLFAFTLDALIACAAAWALVFLASRLRGGSAWWMFAVGAMLALTSFLSFGVLAVWAIIIVALAIQFGVRSFLTVPVLVIGDALARRKPAVHRPISDLVVAVLGFCTLWLLLVFLFPMQPLKIFENAMETHHWATVVRRSYNIWLWLNVAMFVLFCGWPVAVSVVARLGEYLKARWRGARGGSIITLDTTAIIGGATLLTMILLTLSGNVLGEVERLWLFLLAPLCAFASGALPARAQSGYGIGISILVVLQALQTLMMAAALSPVVRPF